MMKRIVLFFLVLTAVSCGGSKNEFKARSWNGYFVQEMSDSYEYFLEHNTLPESITIDGVEYDKGKMFAASHKLLQKMTAEPKKWQRKTVEFNDTLTFVDNERDNTLNIDEISLEDFWINSVGAHQIDGLTSHETNTIVYAAVCQHLHEDCEVSG